MDPVQPLPWPFAVTWDHRIGVGLDDRPRHCLVRSAPPPSPPSGWLESSRVGRARRPQCRRCPRSRERAPRRSPTLHDARPGRRPRPALPCPARDRLYRAVRGGRPRRGGGYRLGAARPHGRRPRRLESVAGAAAAADAPGRTGAGSGRGGLRAALRPHPPGDADRAGRGRQDAPGHGRRPRGGGRLR